MRDGANPGSSAVGSFRGRDRDRDRDREAHTVT
jgi:hypothetical protein